MAATLLCALLLAAPDARELETFVDGVINAELAEKHVAGAAVAVVSDGKIVFSRGYGWADVEKRVPVDPETTLFRIGSNSKVFTWTAVMQLVERGQLDLDADVNRYLDFHIPDTFSQPITMRHLMAHTAGFEYRSFGIEAANAGALQPLGQWLRANLVARVVPPGEVSAYSNYGVALAGYVVERISAMPYDAYLEKNIFAPLGLRHTTSRQPLPPSLAPAMSNGYVYADGKFSPQPFEYLQVGPAGSLSVSANDMARFAIGHLQGDTPLGRATAERMRSRLFSDDPRVDGWAYGMFETTRNGIRAVGHNGGSFYFYSRWLLIPSKNVAFFVAYNTQTARGLVTGDTFTAAFIDHYYPSAPTKPTIVPEDGAAFAGDYWPMRRSFTTAEKIGVLLEGPLTVRVDGDALSIGGTRFVPVGDHLFRSDGRTALFRPPYAFIDGDANRRVRWFERSWLHWSLLGFCALAFLSVPIGLALALRRRALPSRLTRAAWWWALAQAVLFFVYVAGLRHSTATYAVDPLPLVAGTDRVWRALAVIARLWLPLTAGTIVFAVANRTRPGRLHYAFIAVAAAAALWFQQFWCL